MRDTPPRDPRPPVSVVVPTRDRPAQLAECLRGLRSALGADDELVVVDSASRRTEPVAAVVAASNGVLVRCDEPGVNRARNAGWRRARHDVVLFTDDDVVVDAGWVDALATAALAGDDVGFVTGRLLVRGEAQPSRDVALKREEQPATYDRRCVGNLGHGASVALRRDVLARLDGWDESLGVGGRFAAAPEVDLFDRCFGLGLTGRYEPRAVAWHEQWRGPRRLLLLEVRYGFGNGARLAKLVRSDRDRARLVARHSLLDWGLHEVWRELRARHGYPAVGAALRLLATPVGFLAGMTVPVVDGHFAVPSGG